MVGKTNLNRGSGMFKVIHEIIKNGQLQNGYNFTSSTNNLIWETNGLKAIVYGSEIQILSINKPITLDNNKKYLMYMEVEKIGSFYHYFYSTDEQNYTPRVLADTVSTQGFEWLVFKLHKPVFKSFHHTGYSGGQTIQIRNLFIVEVKNIEK